MALRYILVEGDPLMGSTGVIIPVDRSSPALCDIPVAFIGDMVQCFICEDIKPIEKDGGPYRLGIFNGEIDITETQCVMIPSYEFAYENDVINCKCGKKPLQALLARVKQAKDDEDSPMMNTQPVFSLPQGWSIAGRILGMQDYNPMGAPFDAIGGAGDGMERAGGTFRVTNGANATGGQSLSLKHYESGWQGGSRAQITTYDMVKSGTKWGKVGSIGSLVVGGFDVYDGYQQDGGTYGKNAQIATGNAIGGIAGGAYGGAVGAKAGAVAGVTIGSLFAGVGAAPGAVIGAIVGGIIGSVGGGWLGGNVGAETVRQGQEIYNNTNPNNL